MSRARRFSPGTNACLVYLSLIAGVAIFCGFLPLHPPGQVFESEQLRPPVWSEGGVWRFPLGTDDLGRDELSRLIYGARLSLGFGGLTVLASVLLGGGLGLTAGYFGGRWDRAVMRGTDTLMALPSLLLAIVVIAVLGPSLLNALWAVTLVALPSFVRVTRASVLNERPKEYVEASRAFGAGPWRVMLKTILPNCLAPMIVQATLGFSDAILSLAAMGFLGLGAQAPTAEWGTMLSDSRAFLSIAPWLVTLPGFAILSVVITFNLLGDALRDAQDYKL